ncbi:hypothetical protein J6590_074979 [Homalodisca vitripennis]|nr:hypothetical protein J6590_074979 [Homalodisca vitripennis]
MNKVNEHNVLEMSKSKYCVGLGSGNGTTRTSTKPPLPRRDGRDNDSEQLNTPQYFCNLKNLLEKQLVAHLHTDGSFQVGIMYRKILPCRI